MVLAICPAGLPPGAPDRTIRGDNERVQGKSQVAAKNLWLARQRDNRGGGQQWGGIWRWFTLALSAGEIFSQGCFLSADGPKVDPNVLERVVFFCVHNFSPTHGKGIGLIHKTLHVFEDSYNMGENASAFFAGFL